MVESQKYCGKIYRKHRGEKYFTRGTKKLHRVVWEDHHGPIPTGSHIHHIDGDRANNTIENLECITPKEHRQRHKMDDQQRERNRLLLERIRPKASEWHKTKAGRDFHRIIGPMSRKRFVGKPRQCEFCGNDFKTNQSAHIDRFCSNKCKSAWRRKSGADNITRRCELCGSDFTANKYDKRRFCGRSCAARHRRGI